MPRYALYLSGIAQPIELEQDEPPVLNDEREVVTYKTATKDEITVRSDAVVAFITRLPGGGQTIRFSAL
jgi:hypothetical protein